MLPNVFRNLYTARFYSRTFSHLKTTQHWTSDTTVDMAIKLTADGDGSNPPKTIPKYKNSLISIRLSPSK